MIVISSEIVSVKNILITATCYLSNQSLSFKGLNIYYDKNENENNNNNNNDYDIYIYI